MAWEYKMVQIPPTIVIKEKGAKGNEAALYLQNLVNEMAGLAGWEFYRVDEVGVITRPGCLAALFGAKEAVFHYYVVTFRKPL